MAFFPQSKLMSKAPPSLVAKCGACGLFKTCQSPKMTPSGKGRRRFMIVGEAPGADEDERGEAFVGKTGRHLEGVLRKVGVDLRRDCTITNALICRPPNNATPTNEQIDYCRPNLVKTLEEHQPEVIIPLGGAAVQSLLRSIYKDQDIGGITRWAGFDIPCQRINAWICPTYHPSYLIRQEDKVLDLFFEMHLKQAARHTDRPWETVPDYKREVEQVFNPREAASILREFTRRGGAAAFDYEATRLKPEWDDAQIVSCSVCWRGKRTIAYPWLGEAIDATWELLCSPRIWKIASNLKFEDRWTRWFFKRGVVNWGWDTMLAAHCIDNRRGITSIKFQSFVLLGTESYDDHIKPFLKAKKGQKLNRILKEIDMSQLLLYNGLDSLLEYKVAMIQMKGMKYDRTRPPVV